jgi:ribosomal protein S18 acetylase RimI-like enzyme
VTTVEPATMDDLDRLLELWLALAEGQRDHGSRIDPEANADGIRESLAQHVIADGLLVARADRDSTGDAADALSTGGPDDESTVVGFVMFGPDDAGFDRDRTRGVVRNLYVVPGARDRGIGSDLLDAAEQRLCEAGVDEVVLEAMADNEAARRFYRRRGYDTHRVTMTKPLGSDTHTR